MSDDERAKCFGKRLYPPFELLQTMASFVPEGALLSRSERGEPSVLPSPRARRRDNRDIWGARRSGFLL